MAAEEIAIVGGGCFWCTEAVFQQVRGVREVVSGYAGGRRNAPTYEQVCSGATGHAEVVRIAFDPAELSYADLLRIFFATHDPTTRDRQGNDVGSQYRSVIFTLSEAQAQTARAVVDELEAARLFGAPIVTELAPAPTFWPAEAYHQNYFRTHPWQGYCMAVISPKLAKFRKQFTDRLLPDAG